MYYQLLSSVSVDTVLCDTPAFDPDAEVNGIRSSLECWRFCCFAPGLWFLWPSLNHTIKNFKTAAAENGYITAVIKRKSINLIQNLFYLRNINMPSVLMPSLLWRCWFGGRKGIRPVKIEWWDAGMVVCLGQGADLHMAQLMPLPLIIFCSSKSRLVLHSWFYLSGTGSYG